jgi:hypothetical protein
MSDQLPRLDAADAASSIGWIGLCEAVQCHHDQPFHTRLIDSACLTLAYATIAGLPAPGARLFPYPHVYHIRNDLLDPHAPRRLATSIQVANRYCGYLGRATGIPVIRRAHTGRIFLVAHLRCESHPITLPIYPLAVALLLACAAFPFGIAVYRTLVPDAVQDGATSRNEPLSRFLMKGTGI